MILIRVVKAPTSNPPEAVHLISPAAIGVILILLNQAAIFGNGKKPSHGIIGVLIGGGDAGHGLLLLGDPAILITGKFPCGEVLTSDGKILPVYLTVSIKGAGKSEGSAGNRFRQAVSCMAEYGESACTGQKTIIVIGVEVGVAGIGKALQVEVVVVRVSQGLVQGTGQGLRGNKRTVIAVGNRLCSLGDGAYPVAAEIGEAEISLWGLDFNKSCFVIEVIDLVS